MATTRLHRPLLASAEVVQKLQSRSQAALQLAPCAGDATEYADAVHVCLNAGHVSRQAGCC